MKVKLGTAIGTKSKTEERMQCIQLCAGTIVCPDKNIFSRLRLRLSTQHRFRMIVIRSWLRWNTLHCTSFNKWLWSNTSCFIYVPISKNTPSDTKGSTMTNGVHWGISINYTRRHLHNRWLMSPLHWHFRVDCDLDRETLLKRYHVSFGWCQYYRTRVVGLSPRHGIYTYRQRRKKRLNWTESNVEKDGTRNGGTFRGSVANWNAAIFSFTPHTPIYYSQRRSLQWHLNHYPTHLPSRKDTRAFSFELRVFIYFF